MKYSLFVLIPAFAILTTQVKGDNGESSLLLDVWKNVNFLSAKMEIKGIKGFKPDEKFHKFVEWKEDSQGLFYRRVRAERYGQCEFDTTVTYDGENYSRLDRDQSPSVMSISKSVPNVIATFAGGSFPLDPFQYLGVSGGGASNSYPSLTALHRALDNRALLSALTSGKPCSFNGKECLAVTLPVPGTVIEGKSMIYNVYLTASSPHTLVGWERVLMPDKQLESSLVVKEWQSAMAVGSKQLAQYPSKYIRRFYDYDKKPASAEITYEYEVNVSIDSILKKSEKADFSADPGEADRIYDQDNKVMINNPR